MRVIAGTARGCILAFPIDPTTRPVMDRVKKAVFDTLRPSLYNARFLDLFAGTGSIGIEALSQGAAHAFFVELQQNNIIYIRKNLSHTKLGTRATVIKKDAFLFLEESHTQAESEQYNSVFDIIYVAPPQYQGLAGRVCAILDTSRILASEGIVAVQIHPVERPTIMEQAFFSLVLIQEKKYGNTLILYFQKR